MVRKIMSLGLLCFLLCMLAQPTYAQNLGGSSSAESSNEAATSKKSYIKDFGCVYLSYFGGYKDFDKGYYGIGWELFNESGAFANMSYHGSWGITDPGEYQWRVGGGYGIAPVEFAAITARINAMFGSYTKYEYNEKTGKLKEESKFGGGILFAPGVRLKFGKLSFGVNFDLGWAYFGGSGFYKDVELNLGYKF